MTTAPEFASAEPRVSLKQRLSGAVSTMDGTLTAVSSVLLPFGLAIFRVAHVEPLFVLPVP